MAEYNIDTMLSSIINPNDSSWQPADKIPLVIKQIELLKADTRSYLQENAVDVQTILNESQELYIESKSLLDDMKECKVEIEQETMADIIKSIENHDQIAYELDYIRFALDVVLDVIQYDNYLKEFGEAQEARSYTRSVEAMWELLKYLEKPAEGVTQLDIFCATQNVAKQMYDVLLSGLNDEWDRMLSYQYNSGGQETVITISLPIEQSSIVVDILDALEKAKKLNEKMENFAKFILNEVLKNIINEDCEVEVVTDMEIKVSVKSHRQRFKAEFDTVMLHLKTFFDFILRRLNIKFGKDSNFYTIIGQIISSEFCEELVQHCFKDTIPYNLTDLQNYGIITSKISDFQNFLIETKFFPDNDELSILSYVDDMDVLFAERASAHFLETARNIIDRDRSTSMSIGVQNIPEQPDPEYIDITDMEHAEALKVLDETIPRSLFYFPRCMISRNTQELLDLVYIIMEEAVQCSGVVCKKLYCTVRMIFELYAAIVPYHDSYYLCTIPQYVALFHNNCMYFAHNMLTLGDKWLNLLGVAEADYAIGFVDLVQKMRELGHHHLTIHMQQQRKQILDNIRSSDLNCIDVKDVLDCNAESAVRRCLRQFQLLKNVWIGVFPYNIFTRLMATLVNMFIDELIHRVCTVEDISMEIATQLADMYSLVVQKAPQLFAVPEDIDARVKSWIKFQELIFILRASLRDIDSRWNDGVSPLADLFTTDELRNLIKALFQNTQFRANLLSKIK